MEIGTAQRNCRGESECGDGYVIIDNDVNTIALADGLGHGPMAAVAAKEFCHFVKENEAKTLTHLLGQGSTHIARTRGAAVAIIRIDKENHSLQFSGIGNVELQAVSEDSIKPVSVPGIVGRKLRKIKEFDYTLHQGDLLALYTDGISSRFELKSYRHLPAEKIAEKILDDHGKFHDDATCIVIRY